MVSRVILPCGKAAAKAVTGLKTKAGSAIDESFLNAIGADGIHAGRLMAVPVPVLWNAGDIPLRCPGKIRRLETTNAPGVPTLAQAHNIGVISDSLDKLVINILTRKPGGNFSNRRNGRVR